MIISAAAFGRRTGWKDDEVPPGHRLSFKSSIAIVGTGLFTRILCPKWIFEWAPTAKIREARDGFAEFRVRSLRNRPRIDTVFLRINPTWIQSYLLESINERKFSKRGEKRDLLSSLIDANEELLDDGEQRLGEVELIGMQPVFELPVRLFMHLPSRKHVHFLSRWTRGERTLANVQRWLISRRDRHLDTPFLLP